MANIDVSYDYYLAYADGKYADVEEGDGEFNTAEDAEKCASAYNNKMREEDPKTWGEGYRYLVRKITRETMSN